jgi:hypothetical protein
VNIARGWRHAALAFQRRAALGLGPVTAPVTIFIPLGIAIGPMGAGILSATALAHLDVVVTMALATLGVLVGVAGARQAPAMPRLTAAASVQALMTIAIVAGAVFVLLGRWGVPLGTPALVVALALGLSASTSSAPAAQQPGDDKHEVAARVADLDDLLPILLAGLVIGFAAPDPQPGLRAAGVALVVGLGIGACGWLLFERSEGEAERAVFLLGCLALLGGATAFAGGSPLLAGLAAGWFWVAAPGQADRLVADGLRKIEHPLVVLLFITAGASVQSDLLGIWLFVPYVTFRLAGKLIGGWTASRVAPHVAPSDLGTYLIPPGVIGIAFALNLGQVAPAAAAPVVGAVALGAVTCELLTLVITPAGRRT